MILARQGGDFYKVVKDDAQNDRTFLTQLAAKTDAGDDPWIEVEPVADSVPFGPALERAFIRASRVDLLAIARRQP